MEENILTPDQVAKKLQVHPFTVLKFIKQGKLKASKLGRVYRIRASDVELFLDQQMAANSNKGKSATTKQVNKEVSKEALHLDNGSYEEALPKSSIEKPIINKKEDPFGLDHYILE